MTFTMAGSTDACNSMKIRANYKSEFSFKICTKKEILIQIHLHHSPGYQLPIHSHQTPILEGGDPESPHWDHLHAREVDVLPEKGMLQMHLTGTCLNCHSP